MCKSGIFPSSGLQRINWGDVIYHYVRVPVRLLVGAYMLAVSTKLTIVSSETNCFFTKKRKNEIEGLDLHEFAGPLIFTLAWQLLASRDDNEAQQS